MVYPPKATPPPNGLIFHWPSYGFHVLWNILLSTSIFHVLTAAHGQMKGQMKSDKIVAALYLNFTVNQTEM